MGSVTELKRWLTLQSAASHIGFESGEWEVSQADILQLALENKATLSVVFPNRVLASPCIPVAEADLVYTELQTLDGKGTIRVADGGFVFCTPRGQLLQEQNKVVSLDSDEPFDLPMLGGERGSIEEMFWSLLRGNREETTNIDGTFVALPGDQERGVFLLKGILPNSPGEPRRYFPLGQLPQEALVVMRQGAIQELLQRLEGDAPTAVRQPVSVDNAAHPWPWGRHHTKLLGALRAAAAKFWVNFDPSDNTTAPTNEQVSAWLQSQGVGKAMADKMATILRADGVPPGPRK
jgi:hypothetical protein